MKPLLSLGLLLALVTASALAVPAQSEFGPLFARHQEQGTLFEWTTAGLFRARGWGVRYRDAVAALPGVSIEGLTLEIELSPGYQPVVGKPLALDFWLVNQSNWAVSLPVGGTCKTVHAAGAIAVDPEGRSNDWIGRGLDGGPHCFCSQRAATLSPGARVKLGTTIADNGRVSTWEPNRIGKHVVLGQYRLEGATTGRLLSRPLVVEVQAR